MGRMALPHWLTRVNLVVTNWRSGAVPFVVRPILALLRVTRFVELRVSG